MENHIPVIDMDDWLNGSDRSRGLLADRTRNVCHKIGFFYVVNHGIGDQTIARYMTCLKQFFDLPEEKKRLIDKNNSPHFRGWEKLGSEFTNNEVDYREQIDIGKESFALTNPDPYYMRLVGPNQWPDEKDFPGFRRTVNEFVDHLSSLAKEILSVMSLALGLHQSHIEKVFGDDPGPYLKLIRYPKTADGLNGVGVHKDSGFLTLLLQDAVGGLQAQANNGEWLDVNPIANSFVVNIGELMQHLTHNYFIATPHRVKNSSNQTRYSSAFFYSPDLNTKLTPLPVAPELIAQVQASQRHRNEGFMASRAELASGVDGLASQTKPDVFGYKYWERWRRSYPDIMRKFHPDLM